MRWRSARITAGLSPEAMDKTARLWDLSAKDPAANPVVLRGHEGRGHCGGDQPG